MFVILFVILCLFVESSYDKIYKNYDNRTVIIIVKWHSKKITRIITV
jgi:hypothetical protein